MKTILSLYIFYPENVVHSIPKIMKNTATYFTICCFLLLASLVNAQKTSIIKLQPYTGASETALKKYVSAAEVLLIQPQQLQQAKANQAETISLLFSFESKNWEIELEKQVLFSNGFFVKTADDKTFAYDRNAVLHYKGTIKGVPGSFAAISISNNAVMGVLADKNGNINIGPLGNELGENQQHIIFRESNLLLQQPFRCETETPSGTNDSPLPSFAAPMPSNDATVNAEAVDIYFEADYSCFTSNSSNVTNTVNWATAMFNVVTTLYDNDSVLVRMSGIKVWNTADPYAALTSTSTVLNAFSVNMSTGFPGDLAHILSRRSLGGGRAYLNVLCSSGSNRTAVSGNMGSSTNPFPAYSWNSMVVAHELGHNIASNHTQWCGWSGGAIDNCYATEGGCPRGPAPINGGTIMSYCHLNVGINLANGFGPLPGAVIRNAVRNSSCIFPRIVFNKSFESVTEENAPTNPGCNNFIEINLKVAINYQASQPAIITLSPEALSSPGLTFGPSGDLEITPMSFTLTDTITQNIRIKVYNDAIIEPTESVRINYTIAANGTNAVKSGLFQLTINSLDHKPDSAVNRLLYLEPFDSIVSGFGNWTQTLVHGLTSPNRWVIGNNGDPQFSSKAAFVSNNGSTAGYSGASVADSAIIRLESPTINASDFKNMQLSYFYKCNGEGSQGQGSLGGGGGGIDFARVLYSINNGASWTILKDNIFGRNFRTSDFITLPAAANNQPLLKLAFEWQNNRSIVNNQPMIIDSLVITGAGLSNIQTLAAVNNQQEAYIGPNATVHFYNPINKNIIATVRNTSNVDLGCSKLELIRTGNGSSPAWGIDAAERLSNKAFRLTTSNNDPAGLYEISAYFINEELNGWAAATGNTIAEATLIKTTGLITDSLPATAPEYSNYNSQQNFGVEGKIIRGLFQGNASFAIGKAGISKICPGTNKIFSANETGTGYQWQVDNGTGYTNISDNALYNGSNTANLLLTNAPTNMYGYKLRCIISDVMGTHPSIEYSLQFAINWMGTASTACETASNWECGVVPDVNTDVYIKPGTPFSPLLSSNSSVRALTIIGSGTNMQVANGAVLNVVK